MYNRTEIILEAYPGEFSEIQKARGAYLCVGQDGGKCMLKEFSGSDQKAQLLDKLLVYLKEHGITSEQIVYTQEEQPVFADTDGTRYYLRTWLDGRECDTRNREDILCAVRKLAQMHQVTAGFLEEFPQTMCKEADAFCLECERHTRELHKVRNYIRAKKKKNEFEERFLKEYPYYLGQADDALKRLQQHKEEPAERDFGVCHGDYNQHNLLFTAKGPVIINYEHFCRDAYVSDFANFFRKIMEKHNWNTGLGMDMISAYDKIHGLDQWERQQFYLRMAYPEKFWKVANHYFNSKKSWASNRDVEKLSKICSQEMERTEFLRILFYFIQ